MIAKKLDIENEDLLWFLSHALLTFMFLNKTDHKKYGFALILYLFRDISSSKSEKGDNIKLSRACFLTKGK